MLLELPLGNSDLLVRLYLRRPDHRATIVCLTSGLAESTEPIALRLTSLRVRRVASCLQLQRRNRVSGAAAEIWLNMRFPSYEKMIVFYCTFLALRAGDPEHDIAECDDYELAEEEERFGGTIIDDEYEHEIKLLEDKDTGAIRLQASILSGRLKR